MPKIRKQSKKVAVALSGGVDSAVSAHLLKEKGFEVEAFFLRLKFNDERLDSWRQSEGRAALVAKHLNLPFRIIDLSQDFKQTVWEPFWQNCKMGKTINPCTFCNPKIKFGLLLDRVLNLNFTNLATGHYAQIKKHNKKNFLERGVDSRKDQSYFLYRIHSEKLEKIIFPLGKMKKSEVKKIARKVFPKRFFEISESQELCFVPEKFTDFSRKILPEKIGKVLDKKGRLIGKHPGFWFFTEGQKIGLGEMGFKKSLYVLKKDPQKNILIATEDPSDEDFFTKEFSLRECFWNQDFSKNIFQSQVQIRYQTQPIKCQIEIKNKKTLIRLQKPLKSVTKGQAAVFYQKNRVLGGGIIE